MGMINAHLNINKSTIIIKNNNNKLIIIKQQFLILKKFKFANSII